MALLYVPAGEFLMGSVAGDSEADNDEQPQRTVSIDAFWIDQTEVTNEMYERCVSEGACHAPNPTSSSTREQYYGNIEFGAYPVINVSWDDATAYCTWSGRRLPTEAEWEKAARGPEGRRYPWGNEEVTGKRANFCDQNCSFGHKDTGMNDGYADTAPVGSYLPGGSPYGALDMAGNVWEWVADFYGRGYYASAPASNPAGPVTGEFHVLRGGAWSYVARSIRTAFRHWDVPSVRFNYVGFRCALSE